MRAWLKWVPTGKTPHSLLFGVLPKYEGGSVEALKGVLEEVKKEDLQINAAFYMAIEGIEVELADQQHKNFSGFTTALYKAAIMNHPEAVALLLNAGADPFFSGMRYESQEDFSETPLTPLELVRKLKEFRHQVNYDAVEELLVQAEENAKEIVNQQKEQNQPLLTRLLNDIKGLLEKLDSISIALMLFTFITHVLNALSVIKAMYARTSTAVFKRSVGHETNTVPDSISDSSIGEVFNEKTNQSSINTQSSILIPRISHI